MNSKRIITVATTEAWPKKTNNPNLPTQPDEIAEEIYRCWKAGAAVAHIHVRDENDNDSMKVETFKTVLDNLKNDYPDCDIVINLIAVGGIANSENDRMAPFKTLRPEMASFDCGTMNCPAIERAGDLAAILTNLSENDVLFIDEIQIGRAHV